MNGDIYNADHNAISRDGKITTMAWSLIRNAADFRAAVENAETGDVYYQSIRSEDDPNGGHGYAATYVSAYGQWYYVSDEQKLAEWQDGWYPRNGENLTDPELPEGTRLNVTLQAATEYSLGADGKVDWDSFDSNTNLDYVVEAKAHTGAFATAYGDGYIFYCGNVGGLQNYGLYVLDYPDMNNVMVAYEKDKSNSLSRNTVSNMPILSMAYVSENGGRLYYIQQNYDKYVNGVQTWKYGIHVLDVANGSKVATHDFASDVTMVPTSIAYDKAMPRPSRPNWLMPSSPAPSPSTRPGASRRLTKPWQMPRPPSTPSKPWPTRRPKSRPLRMSRKTHGILKP